MGSLSKIHVLVDSLSRLSHRYPDNFMLSARASYWRARYLFKIGHGSQAAETIKAAMERLDSARFVYDFFKLRSELERTDRDPARRFRLGQENVDYFRSVGDSLSVAHSLLSLGFMYLKSNDSLRARSSFVQAGEIWREQGLITNYTKNLLNVAISSSRDEQLRIYDVLLRSPVMRADTAAYEIVLRNYAILDTGEVGERCCRLALSLIEGNSSYRHLVPVHRGILAGRMIDTAPDSALSMALDAFKNGDYEHESPEGLYIATTLIKAWQAVGRSDSALVYNNRINEAIANESDHALAISIEAGRHALAEANLTARLNEQRQSRTFLIIVFVIVVLALIGLIILYRRSVEREMREKVAETKLRESQSRLARETVLFEHKERMIDSVRSQIENAASQGNITHGEAGKILTTLRMYSAGREERQAFLDIHDHLLPGFSRRLKEDFPMLTEGQIKLAAYIGSGMSNASIAKLLNITVQSVRTNRYRLRSRFNLVTGDSLEDFIRRYTAIDHTK